MKKSKVVSCFFVILMLWPFVTVWASVSKTDLKKQIFQAASGLHLPFVENKGQVVDSKVAYVADTFVCRVSVTKDGQIVYGLPGDKKSKLPSVEIKERLFGEGVKVQVNGRKIYAAKVSYYPGRDKTKWRSNVPTYEQISMGRVASGIKMALSARGNNVEKLFFVEPGADPTDIHLKVEGAKSLTVKDNGELELATASGVMRFSKPIAYQEIGGGRRMVEVSYKVKKNIYGFAFENYDTSKELVIDPLITVFPIIQGSRTHNLMMALAKDQEGNIYAAGASHSELSIFKMDSQLENILASTYFSEDARYTTDMIFCMAIDSQGNVIVSGTTLNPDYPVTDGCYDNRIDDLTYSAQDEGFVTKFSEDLQTIVASTFIGGDRWDGINAMVVDEKDQIYVAGYSSLSSSDDDQQFPVTDGAWDEELPPASGAFIYKGVISKFDADLSSLLASTFLGGQTCDKEYNQCQDVIHSMALDDDGNIWVAGHTTYPDFPVTDGCLDSSYNEESDVFLSKLDSNLSQLLISTYIGGIRDEEPTDIRFDSLGNIYLLGWTYSSGFPMPIGGYMPEHSQYEEDGFLLKLTPSADEILAGTFIAGAYDGTSWGDDVPAAMAFSADGSKLHVVGRTESETFPTTSDCYADVVDAGIDRTMNSGFEAFFARDADDYNWGDGFLATFSTDLDQLLYSTYLGGEGCDYLDAILINGDDVIIAGETKSDQFPMIEVEDDDVISRGVLLRFGDTTTSVETDDTDDTDNSQDDSGGGGGGGGCFISNLF